MGTMGGKYLVILQSGTSNSNCGALFICDCASFTVTQITSTLEEKTPIAYFSGANNLKVKLNTSESIINNVYYTCIGIGS